MKLDHRIYGEFEIEDTVLLEIMASDSLERLKGINQSGIPFAYPERQKESRYDHCVGVMLLLRRFGASLEEQVAGLIHDVSHTAFSHVIDWAHNNGHLESDQDDIFESFLSKSDIKPILLKYGYDISDYTNLEKFKLLENECPDICADRIDYSLIELDYADEVLDRMKTEDNLIYFNDKDLAKKYTLGFLDLQTNHWASRDCVWRYHTLGQLVKYALENDHLSEDDLWTDDDHVVAKLDKVKNKRFQNYFELLRTDTCSSLPLGEQILYKKFRFIDPYVKHFGVFKRISKLDAEVKEKIEFAKAENSKGIIEPRLDL